jgi:hypothetical protein
MTGKEFVENVIGYYGPYLRPLNQSYVELYLTKARGNDLELLWSMLIKTYSTKWNAAPDVAILNEIVGGHNKIEHEKVLGHEILQGESGEGYEQIESRSIGRPEP